MVSPSVADQIVAAVQASPLKGRALRQFAMEQLDQLESYNWSGIYTLHGDVLRLDAFVGEETDHTEIPVGRGVCGTAVAENANQVVADVRALSNYLACSLKTRSEIVVLIRKNGIVVGQIDIDSHQVGAFGPADERLLEQIAHILGERWEA